MSVALLELKDKVQRILTAEFGRVEIDDRGDFTLRHESARLFIGCWEGQRATFVQLTCPVLFDVPPSPGLFEHVAASGGSWIFGHLYTSRREDGLVNVYMRHSLLGDYLDAEELLHAAYGVLGTANDIDDDLAARFGGEVYHAS
jgi:hypothetical protein